MPCLSYTSLHMLTAAAAEGLEVEIAMHSITRQANEDGEVEGVVSHPE